MQQKTFDFAPRAPRPKAQPKPPKEQFPPIAPPDLTQEASLWLTGQRSVALQRGRRYVPASIKHPGKMWPDIAGSIIDTYTQPGDLILDCMAGIGTTLVEAMERGRFAVGVEIVPHWYRVAFANICRTWYRGAPGGAKVLNGDARRLVELAGDVYDMAMFSPPYGPAQTGRGIALSGIQDGRPLIERCGGGAYDAAVVSPPYGDSNVRQMPTEFSESGPGGHFSDPPRGYDAAVVSPPYGPATHNGGGTGIDPAPPEEGEWAEYEAGRAPSPGWRGYAQRAYAARNHDAIQFSAAVMSPAYGDIRQDGGAHQFGESGAMGNYSGESRVKRSRDTSNIGNLKYGSMDKAIALCARLVAGEAVDAAEWPGMQYLETMAVVYHQCYQVLRPGGLIILVLKDYRRDKKRVNLVGDTQRLLEALSYHYHDQALALTSSIQDMNRAQETRIPLTHGIKRHLAALGHDYRDRVLALVNPAQDIQTVAKVSPFVRLGARKAEVPQLLPAGEVVLVYRKPGSKEAAAHGNADPTR